MHGSNSCCSHEPNMNDAQQHHDGKMITIHSQWPVALFLLNNNTFKEELPKKILVHSEFARVILLEPYLYITCVKSSFFFLSFLKITRRLAKRSQVPCLIEERPRKEMGLILKNKPNHTGGLSVVFLLSSVI